MQVRCQFLEGIILVKVMIVDDDIFMHKVFDRILSLGGHDVIEHAFNGQEAVEKFTGNMDLILMDYRMPVKNGVNSTKEIIESLRSVKIIFVSADDSVQNEAMDAGAILFLSKPIRSKKLLSAIDEAIGVVASSITEVKF